MKKLSVFFIAAFCAFGAVADDTFAQSADSYEFAEWERITCTQKVFANALQETANEVTEDDSEFEIEAWIYKNFQNPDVVKQVLACPDPWCEFDAEETCPKISEMDETESVVFPPVTFQFPLGREITINYETQPKILKQRVLLAGKRALPDSNPSPRIGAPDDPSIWTNTEPAWYGILVVQAGSLDKFVGEDKNNVISMRYVEDHFKEIYPRNHNTTTVKNAGGLITTPQCTSVSAFADNNDIVNIAGKRTVNLEGDDNDYYVAGTANLNWISWAQVALDVTITVATVGGGTVILGATKGARAAKASKDLVKSMNEMRKIDKVKDFVQIGKDINKAEDALTALRAAEKSADLAGDIKKLETQVDTLRKAGKSTVNAQKELDSLRHGQRLLGRGEDATKYQRELDALNKAKIDAEKLDDVKKYNEAVKALADIEKLRTSMKAWRMPQRGNVIARSFRTAKASMQSLRAINKGNKIIDKGAKVARVGTKAGNIRNWLFYKTALHHSALKNAGRLAKMERSLGMLYGAVKFIGGMYDFTETSTGEFTSNIGFSPLGLLSADNLAGQENVINHGMWLMWLGDSLSPADDDAAYLQAMDFANKFAMDMDDVQEELSGSRKADTMCNVDIYVVRPIVRYMDEEDEDGQLYYLIMNDIPWQIRP